MLFYKQSGNTTKATGQWKAGRGAPGNVWPGCVLQKNRAGKETKMETRSRYRTARRLLIFWTLFIGLGAVAGAAGMLIDPSGKAMGMDAMLPYFQVLPFAEVVFQDFTFSGIALLIVNGLSNLTAAGFLLAKKKAGIVLGGSFVRTLVFDYPNEAFFAAVKACTEYDHDGKSGRRIDGIVVSLCRIGKIVGKTRFF